MNLVFFTKIKVCNNIFNRFYTLQTFKKPDCKISDGTTYNMSYYGFDPNVARHCRGTPKIAKENLTSAGDFSSDTTHKVSIVVFSRN